MNTIPQQSSLTLCNDLSITIEERILLKKQSLLVTHGSVTVLMGPSGVGKSVLADVLFGLARQKGAIKWKGQCLNEKNIGALVFQSGGGLPHVSAFDNLALTGAKKNDVLNMLQAFDLSPKQGCAYLSGGESRRLAVARALVAGRKLLWLDEPAAGLDVKRVDALAGQIKRQAVEHNVAIIITSHRANFTTAVADKIVLLDFDGEFKDLSVPHSAEILQEILRNKITDQTLPSIVKRKRFSFGSFPLKWIEHWARSIYGTILLPFSGSRVAWKTLLHTLYIAAFQGWMFYVIVGGIFGVIFLLIFTISLPFMNTARIISEFGPIVIHRLSPAFAGILAAARAGSATSAWLGQITATRQLDALRVLNVNVSNHILSPIWIGLSIASFIGTLLFAFSLTAVFASYLENDTTGSAVKMIHTMIEAEGAYALAKSAFFGTIVAAITISFASAKKRRADEVATAITKGIVHATVWIMIFELIVLTIQSKGF